MDRLEGEFGPRHGARQRMQARRRHRKPQRRAAAVGDIDVTARTELGRRRREAASIERVPGVSDGNRLDHLQFRIAPQGIEM